MKTQATVAACVIAVAAMVAIAVLVQRQGPDRTDTPAAGSPALPASTGARVATSQQGPAPRAPDPEGAAAATVPGEPGPHGLAEGIAAGTRPGDENTPASLMEDPAGVLAALFADASEEDRELFLRGEGPLHERMRALFADAVGLEAAEFAMRLTLLASDWPAAREYLREHARQTGEDHRHLMLHFGLQSGQISSDEIMALINSGASLPPLAIHTLAGHGQAAEIAALAMRAQFTDLGERHPVTGHTAIGSLVERVALAPPEDPLLAVAQLTTLLELGIETRQSSGQIDLLSQILIATEPWNRSAMLAMAAHVVQAGVVSAPEQMTLWAQAPGADDRQRLQNLFDSLRGVPLDR
jgi:hypothetical protein